MISNMSNFVTNVSFLYIFHICGCWWGGGIMLNLESTTCVNPVSLFCFENFSSSRFSLNQRSFLWSDKNNNKMIPCGSSKTADVFVTGPTNTRKSLLYGSNWNIQIFLFQIWIKRLSRLTNSTKNRALLSSLQTSFIRLVRSEKDFIMFI